MSISSALIFFGLQWKLHLIYKGTGKVIWQVTILPIFFWSMYVCLVCIFRYYSWSRVHSSETLGVLFLPRLFLPEDMRGVHNTCGNFGGVEGYFCVQKKKFRRGGRVMWNSLWDGGINIFWKCIFEQFNVLIKSIMTAWHALCYRTIPKMQSKVYIGKAQNFNFGAIYLGEEINEQWSWFNTHYNYHSLKLFHLTIIITSCQLKVLLIFFTPCKSLNQY